MTTYEELKEAFDIGDFRKMGNELIGLLADTYENVERRKVIPYKSPEEQYSYWKDSFTKIESPLSLFSDVIEKSILYQHPNYMGHQTAVPAFSSILASLVIDFLNNGMGVYEMGMVGNAMERVLSEHLCGMFGLGSNASGFVTSGGTLGSLTALLTARANFINQMGLGGDVMKDLCVITSEQSHYCIERAVLTMGLGENGIIKIPVNEKFQMRTELLEAYYEKAVKDGQKVFCIVGSAPSTSTGAYDDLQAIASFCRKNKIWFHVDGAHGAGVIFSSRYQHLVNGIENADSIVMDFHKMMLTPSLATAVLLKNRNLAFNTFKQKADYLWQKQDNEWQHGGKSTFECTKNMMVLKVYTLFKQFGNSVFEQYMEKQYDLASEFFELIEGNPDFELAHKPESNIVCFRYKSCEQSDLVNSMVREQLVAEGDYYLVQTILNGNIYLRVTLMNPTTTMEHLKGLLKEITKKAQEIAYR